jgi:ABC-type nickel/cobalt efflux system permease component RcnA
MMTTAAWIMLVVSQVIVTTFTVYLFVKVMRTPTPIDEEHDELLFGP